MLSADGLLLFVSSGVPACASSVCADSGTDVLSVLAVSTSVFCVSSVTTSPDSATGVCAVSAVFPVSTDVPVSDDSAVSATFDSSTTTAESVVSVVPPLVPATVFVVACWSALVVVPSAAVTVCDVEPIPIAPVKKKTVVRPATTQRPFFLYIFARYFSSATISLYFFRIIKPPINTFATSSLANVKIM